MTSSSSSMDKDQGTITTLDPIVVTLDDSKDLTFFVHSRYDELSPPGLAILRPPPSTDRKIENTILNWSDETWTQSGMMCNQTVKWDAEKGCGIMKKDTSPGTRNLLAYYRAQRQIGSGNEYPKSHDIKGIQQLASACQNDTLWPKGTWDRDAGALEMEEKSLWDNMGDSKVPRRYEQERNLIFETGEGLDMGNMGDPLHALKMDERVQDFEGINTPYAYFGGRHTLFGFHREDFDFLSVNRLLFGAPKIWYSIPSHHEVLFEKVLRELFADEFKKCPLWYRRKLAMIDPATLVKHGIDITRVVQYPGDIVVTFPTGWHSGFNVGFNCAEAVNFVVDQWIPYGMEARVCRCSDAFYGWSLIARAFAEHCEIHLGAHIRVSMGIA